MVKENAFLGETRRCDANRGKNRQSREKLQLSSLATMMLQAADRNPNSRAPVARMSADRHDTATVDVAILLMLHPRYSPS